MKNHVIEMIRLIGKLAEINCCCPTHSFPMDTWADRGCPGGDCEDCQDCLSAEARRIVNQLKEALR